jgi:hypothetical protein
MKAAAEADDPRRALGLPPRPPAEP